MYGLNRLRPTSSEVSCNSWVRNASWHAIRYTLSDVQHGKPTKDGINCREKANSNIMVFGHLPLIKWNTHPIFHFKLLLEIGEGGLKITLSHRPWVLVRIQRRIWGITCGKNKFIKERIGMSRMNRKNTSRERWVKPRETLAPEWWVKGIFKTRLLYIHACSSTWVESFDWQLLVT